MTRKLIFNSETWPIAGSFNIARESKSEVEVVKVCLSNGNVNGYGECVPYRRYGESVASVTNQIESIREAIEKGLDRHELQQLLPAGAARNAVDCALWDLDAKQNSTTVAKLAEISPLQKLVTAYTLSLDNPESMGEKAAQAAARPLIKVKLGGDGDEERIKSVRMGAPNSTLIVDANESWNSENFAPNLKACETAGVKLVEQPFPVGEDQLLRNVDSNVIFCADESVHVTGDIQPLSDRYQAINIKLDKAGGLTEALIMQQYAKRAGMKIMVGCMLATSLAMAPAMLVAQGADFVDLDGPLLLERDRQPGIKFAGSTMYPPPPQLWG